MSPRDLLRCKSSRSDVGGRVSACRPGVTRRADHAEVGLVPERRQVEFELARMPHVVRVQKGHELRPCFRQAEVSGRGHAAIRFPEVPDTTTKLAKNRLP